MPILGGEAGEGPAPAQEGSVLTRARRLVSLGAPSLPGRTSELD